MAKHSDCQIVSSIAYTSDVVQVKTHCWIQLTDRFSVLLTLEKVVFLSVCVKGNVWEICTGQNFLQFQESVHEILPYTAHF